MNTPSAPLRRWLPAGRHLVIAAPYGWLLLFFLLPFLFVLQISFSEVEIASPPYRPLLSQAEDVLNIALNLGNYRDGLKKQVQHSAKVSPWTHTTTNFAQKNAPASCR